MTSSTFAWLTLAASVLAEVLGTLALRHADGLSRPWPTFAMLACYGCAIWWMSLAVCIDPVNSCSGVNVEGNDDEHPDGRRHQALDSQA